LILERRKKQDFWLQPLCLFLDSAGPVIKGSSKSASGRRAVVISAAAILGFMIAQGDLALCQAGIQRTIKTAVPGLKSRLKYTERPVWR
jgi:hypothetical protein